MRSIARWHFQWPWRIPNPVFKVTAFLKSNIVKTARLKDKVTIGQEETISNIWNGNVFGDLGWPVNASRGFVSISRASCFALHWCASEVTTVWRYRNSIIVIVIYCMRFSDVDAWMTCSHNIDNRFKVTTKAYRAPRSPSWFSRSRFATGEGRKGEGKLCTVKKRMKKLAHLCRN